MMGQNVKLVHDYFQALSAGDLNTAASFLSDNLVWHQPGKSKFSGTFSGKAAVFSHIDDFFALSDGSFAIDNVEYIAENKDFVVASISFKAAAREHSMGMKGIDLFRVENNQIQEVWLFSEDIETEDQFWTMLSKYTK